MGQAGTEALSAWLAQRIRSAIAQGHLPVGSRLPPSRALASELRVSRGVVTEAYRRLIDDGHLAGRGRAGTIVLRAPINAPPQTGPATGKKGPSFARARDLFKAEPGPEVFEWFHGLPAAFNLAPGVPDLGAFPRAAWLRAERQVLKELPASALGYGDPRGAPPLRTAVANWLARNRGIPVSPGDVVVVAGVAQGLALLAEVLRRAGLDRIAVEDPGSLGARQLLQTWGAGTPPVAVDAAGLSVSALEATASRAVLVTPAHQFPMGVVLDGERRRQLLAWSVGGGLIIEDDYDAEHRYDRAPVPALRSLCPDGVFYLGSVSKLLAPALRIGWLISPPRYQRALVTIKRDSDLGNAVLPQLVMARLMEEGQLERHLRALRRHHRTRRDAMLRALAVHLPGAVVHGAAAGLHLTVTFASAIDDTDLAAAAFEDGVKVQPLSWHRQSPGPPGLVLGYAASTPDAISAGVAILRKAFRRCS